ncbi:MAG: heptaprenylglyceryl phosphate synthase, partial [Halodesulfurarchaeum sp.]
MVWRTREAVGRDLETLGHLLRTLLPFDRNPVPAEWTHITKIDPEPEKQFPTLYPLYLQHTDAVSVGGSSNVTDRNTEETFELLEEARTKAFHEPSEARHVTRNTISAAEFLAIPEVLNGHSDALVGTLGEGIHYLESEIVPEIVSRTVPGWVRSGRREQLVSVLVDILLQRAVFEAYIIQNPESEAAKQSGVSKSDTLTPAEARDRAMAAERHLDSEIIYLEYSGTFGDDEAEAILNEISGGVTGPRIWYGGGIDSREKATKMLQAGADTVIVGDIFHDIADEERQLFDELREDVEGAPTRSNIADWLREHVDMEATSAARYLSTIPSV